MVPGFRDGARVQGWCQGSGMVPGFRGGARAQGWCQGPAQGWCQGPRLLGLVLVLTSEAVGFPSPPSPSSPLPLHSPPPQSEHSLAPSPPLPNTHSSLPPPPPQSERALASAALALGHLHACIGRAQLLSGRQELATRLADSLAVQQPYLEQWEAGKVGGGEEGSRQELSKK